VNNQRETVDSTIQANTIGWAVPLNVVTAEWSDSVRRVMTAGNEQQALELRFGSSTMIFWGVISSQANALGRIDDYRDFAD